jgi:tripartite-type tricarboxylate transporter receptor subunit TctC
MFKRLCAALALAAASLAPGAFAQGAPKFPERPVTLIVGYPPGGASDTLARLVGRKMEERLGQPVVIDNRPGASGVIAAQQMLNQPADGHTLLLVINSFTINSSVIAKLPYDPAKDFAPVGTFASIAFLLAVNSGVKAGNLDEFIALARRTQGGLSYGTVGSAGIGRLIGEQFGDQTGTTTRYIPYKGSAPLLTDLLGGTIDYVIDTTDVYLDHIAAGKVRPIAISGAARQPALPNVPTFAEAGLPQFNPRMWFGLLTRAGTPENAIQTLSSALREAMSAPEIRKALAAKTFEPYVTTPSEFGKLLTEETARNADLVKRANIKAE